MRNDETEDVELSVAVCVALNVVLGMSERLLNSKMTKTFSSTLSRE